VHLAGAAAFVALAINPMGGLLIAIPFAVVKLGYPAWIAVLAGIPLGYVQVVAVDLLYGTLSRWSLWQRTIEKRRHHPHAKRLLESRGGFWFTLLIAPIIGPWLVMAFMRFVEVPHRRVAVPILLGIAWSASVIGVIASLVPHVFHVAG
jgi:hypothetical protein